MKSLFYCLVTFQLGVALVDMLRLYLESGEQSLLKWGVTCTELALCALIFRLEWRKLK